MKMSPVKSEPRISEIYADPIQMIAFPFLICVQSAKSMAGAYPMGGAEGER